MLINIWKINQRYNASSILEFKLTQIHVVYANQKSQVTPLLRNSVSQISYKRVCDQYLSSMNKKKVQIRINRSL